MTSAKSIDDLTERVQLALSAPGCERLAEWAAIGPVQRASVEQFAQSLAQPVEVRMLTDDEITGCYGNSENDRFAVTIQREFARVNGLKVKP